MRPFLSIKLIAAAGTILKTETERSRNGRNDMSRAQDVATNLLASAGIDINGERPSNIHVQDRRFFSRVLASGTLGFGESFKDRCWDCDALDENRCRAVRCRLQASAVP